MRKPKKEIQLTSYDELLGINEAEQNTLNQIVEVPLNELHPFRNHPFHVNDDEKMAETVESIKNYGILNPALVRPRAEGGYELIAGHRRKRGCELAGKSKMPVLIRNYTDDEAVIVMVDSNIQRESLLPSEKAYAYKMKMDAVKHQGIKDENAASVDSADLVGQAAGDSGRTVQRYIRFLVLVCYSLTLTAKRADENLLMISKIDMTDGSSEVKGAKLYILNENQEVMESWTSGDQPHYVEKLPIGTYTLLEETAPKGYIVANKVTFEVKDTGDVQGAKMEDEQAMGKVILNKTDKDTKKPMKGVEFALCDSKGKVLETLVTDSAGHSESKNYPIATFKNGQYKKAITYILKETKTLDGYQLDETEHKIQFEYVNDRTPVIEYTLDLTNEKAPEKDTPETSENQEGSTPVSHSSDATSVSSSPKTGDNTNIAIFVLALAVSAGCLGTVVTVKRKRK